MKNHVLRPLYLAIAFVVLLLLVRQQIVPADFGVNGENFTYGYHRAGDIEDWESFPVKYQGKEYCGGCHMEQYDSNMASKHREIQCENCHSPAGNHPEDPAKLNIDRGRHLCLRCHAALPYPSSHRSELPAIDPEAHNTGMECIMCHNPHKPSLEGI